MIPEAVQLDEEGLAQGMAYTLVVPVLVNAMQEQQTMIEELKATVEALKNESNTDK